jgi:hypothetical protein
MGSHNIPYYDIYLQFKQSYNMRLQNKPQPTLSTIASFQFLDEQCHISHLLFHHMSHLIQSFSQRLFINNFITAHILNVDIANVID